MPTEVVRAVTGTAGAQTVVACAPELPQTTAVGPVGLLMMVTSLLVALGGMADMTTGWRHEVWDFWVGSSTLLEAHDGTPLRVGSEVRMSTAQAVALPGGATLASGEVPLAGHRFMYSTVAFYLGTDLVFTNRRLYAMRPNTILGLVPVGTSRSNFPIENIAGVNAGTRFLVGLAILGVLTALLGFAMLPTSSGGLGVALLVLGILAVVASPRQTIEVMNSGGGTITFPVSVVERSKAVAFALEVSNALATVRSGPAPTGRAWMPAGTFAGGPTGEAGDGAAEGLRQLQSLRAQGLISDAEFAAKRNEILSRI